MSTSLTDTSKDAAVKWLVGKHFDADPGIREVYRFMSLDEQATGEPVKLLEVSSNTFATGRADFFGFGPSREFPYSLVIATITPDEMALVRQGKMPLPSEWSLDTVERITRRSRSAGRRKQVA